MFDLINLDGSSLLSLKEFRMFMEAYRAQESKRVGDKQQ